MIKKISHCRVCGNAVLAPMLDLGEQVLTGVFPRNKRASVTSGPLRLVKCTGGDHVCGLLQLEHTYDLAEMYGLNYGYRSGLNASMVAHLRRKVDRIDVEDLADGRRFRDRSCTRRSRLPASTVRSAGRPAVGPGRPPSRRTGFRSGCRGHRTVLPCCSSVM